MQGLLFKIQLGHHHSPPASQIDHEQHQLSGNWSFSHSQTTIAKCGGAPSCMKIKSLILSQALIIGQTSSLSIVEYLLAFNGIMTDEGTHNPIRSHSTPYHYLGLILHFFTDNTWIFSSLVQPGGVIRGTSPPHPV